MNSSVMARGGAMLASNYMKIKDFKVSLPGKGGSFINQCLQRHITKETAMLRPKIAPERPLIRLRIVELAAPIP